MNYPECKGSLNIDPETGMPDDDRMDDDGHAPIDSEDEPEF
jgi:hypothetical protein